MKAVSLLCLIGLAGLLVVGCGEAAPSSSDKSVGNTAPAGGSGKATAAGAPAQGPAPELPPPATK